MRPIKPLLIIFIILSLFDTFITYVAINLGHIEANPVMSYIINIGFPLFFIVKISGILIIYHIVKKRDDDTFYYPLIFADIIYFLGAIGNSIMILA